jgi:ubiquitin carboxyl-terminal hydrolase 4/11/15
MFNSSAAEDFSTLADSSSGRSGLTLEHCLRSFTGTEVLEGYKCEACKKTTAAQRRSTLARTPRVLGLHLKRFGEMRQGFPWLGPRREKLDTHVDFPLTDLSLAEFSIDESSTKSQPYELFAVIVSQKKTKNKNSLYC